MPLKEKYNLEDIKKILNNKECVYKDIPERGDFDLNPSLAKIFRNEVESKAIRKAAAVITLIVEESEIFVLMTKRPSSFSSHPGLWCFPGGKVDNGETVEKAALREVEEEIGVSSSCIEIIGKLPNFWVCSDVEGKPGFNLSPYIGVFKEGVEFKLNPDEIVQTIKIPIDFALNKDNFGVEDGDYCLSYEGAFIKGASPALLVMLIDIMSNKIAK